MCVQNPEVYNLWDTPNLMLQKIAAPGLYHYDKSCVSRRLREVTGREWS